MLYAFIDYSSGRARYIHKVDLAEA